MYHHVSSRLKSMGPDVIPILEKVSIETDTSAIQERIIEVIKDIQIEDIKRDFRTWTRTNQPDILHGSFLVSKLCNPLVRFDQIYDQVIKIKKQIWLELHQYLTPFEQVSIINQIIFYYQNYQLVEPNEHQLSYYHLDSVLKIKKGNSLSLGILYLVLAELLHIPIYGIFLPKQFILAYCKDYSFNKNLGQDDVLFYINPMNKGAVFTRNEIKDYLQVLGLEPENKYFVPWSNTEIIRSQLEILKLICSKKEHEGLAQQIQSIIDDVYPESL